MADKPNTEEEVAPAGGKKKLILIITGALLLVGISVGVTLMLLGGNDGADTTEMKVEDTGPTKGDAIYFDLKPFTVNLSADDPVGFLQVQVQVLTFYFEVSDLLEKHRPLIRNNLTLIFSRQNSKDLRSPEGKQALQKQVLESIQSVVDKYGKGGEVDNVFFTNFVMQ